MAEGTVYNPTPQFSTAEYPVNSGNECSVCKRKIAGRYFRVAGEATCATCTQLQRGLSPQDSHSAYTKGLVFGIVGAIAGCILYATVTIVTGLMIGYVSLAVGFLVGAAMKKGSGGIVGRRYQITAVLLTYAAVSLAAIPIAISQFSKDKQQKQTTSQMSPRPAGETPDSQGQPSTNDQPSTDGQSVSPRSPSPAKVAPSYSSFGSVLAKMVLIGLASPFLELQDPLHGLIGLVILFVGMRIAWKITAGAPGVEITGPYESSPSATA